MRPAMVATLLLTGFVGGLVVAPVRVLEFDAKLSMGDLLNALVTLLVAVALGVIFQRNFSADRVERDLLIAQIREVGAAMKAARELVVRAYTTTTVSEDGDREIVAAVRDLSNQLTTLDQASAQCSTDYRAEPLTSARKRYTEFRRLVTERAFTTQPYSEETYSRAETTYGLFNHALLMYSIHVNKR